MGCAQYLVVVAGPLLPFIEENQVYSLIDYTFPGNCFSFNSAQSVNNYLGTPCNKFVETAACPSDVNSLQIYMDGTGPYAVSNYFGSEGSFQPSSFVPSAYNGVLFYGSSVRFKDVSDGTATTLLAGERHPQRPVLGLDRVRVWQRRLDGRRLAVQLRLCPGFVGRRYRRLPLLELPHGRLPVCVVDGSVHFIDYAVDANVFDSLATRAGGEVIDQSTY